MNPMPSSPIPTIFYHIRIPANIPYKQIFYAITVLFGIVYRHEAFLVKRNQIVNTVHLIQWEVGVDTVCPWRTVYEPSATDTAFELIPVKCIRPVHEEFKIIEFSPSAMAADNFCRFIRVQFIQTRIDTLFSLCA